MKKIALILLVCFCSIITKPVYAQTVSAEEDWDYLEIVEGTPAPMNGLLFSYDGMSNALARVQQKVKLVELQKEQEKQNLKINLEAQIKLSDAKLSALQEQHDNQIKIKNDAINSLTKDLELSKTKIYGGMFLGVAAGVLIMGLIYGNK